MCRDLATRLLIGVKCSFRLTSRLYCTMTQYVIVSLRRLVISMDGDGIIWLYMAKLFEEMKEARKNGDVKATVTIWKNRVWRKPVKQ